MIVLAYDMDMKYDNETKCSRVGERGQVTIPKELRHRYGIRAGQEVLFEEHAAGLLLRRLVPEDPLRALRGRIREEVDVDRYLADARGPGWSKDLDE